MLMSGPLLTGYTQTINDWYDREIDAINEPYRPIPSGAIPEGDVIAQIWILLLAGLGVAYGLDVYVTHCSIKKLGGCTCKSTRPWCSSSPSSPSTVIIK